MEYPSWKTGEDEVTLGMKLYRIKTKIHLLRKINTLGICIVFKNFVFILITSQSLLSKYM